MDILSNNPITIKRQSALPSFLVFFLFMLPILIPVLKNKEFAIAGYSYFIVSSSSMEPTYKTNSLIFVKKEPFKNLRVGDVIVYRSSALNNRLAFHRIINIVAEGIYTKGDNNLHEDNQLITHQDYAGKSIAQSYTLGLYICLIQRPVGFSILFLFPVMMLTIIYYIANKTLKKDN